MVLGSVERALGLQRLNRKYRELVARAGDEVLDARRFTQLALQVMDIELSVEKADLELVPTTGPAVVVANHPFGGIDGIVLGALLSGLRPDVKILANELLGRIPELRPMLILVDALSGKDAAARNAASLREALRWLADGHLLVVFPAGEVSSLSLRRRRVTDPAWNPTVCRLAERVGAPIVPAHFVGRNRTRFQVAGLVHPRLRTVLLPREMLAKRGARIEVRFGAPLSVQDLRLLPDGYDPISHLRERVEWLGGREAAQSSSSEAALERAAAPKHAALAPAVDPELFAREFAALPAERCLAESSDLCVVWARAAEIPNALQEIGRLRELTFRQVGEGTGRAVDLDEFDRHYLHLVLWSKQKREIAGAYRCAFTDDVLPRRGVAGLYTSTLFRFDERFFERLGPALELGRSFVRLERQRSFAPLLLLWKGICSLVVAHPGCNTVFGAVSISARYHPSSRSLMVRWLEERRLAGELETLVTAREPVDRAALASDVTRLVDCLGDDLRRLSAVVGDLEPGRRGVPVLLREYLELGGRIAAFNSDPQFSDVLDGLVVVELAKVPERVLARYMGREVARAWFARHAASVRATLARSALHPQLPRPTLQPN
jgi:putative hemolysin